MDSEGVGEHFRQYSDKYRHAAQSVNKKLHDNIAQFLNKTLYGTVVDIGNGGFFNYDTHLLDKIVAVDLTFPERPISTGRVAYITADARDLSVIPSESCDCVLLQFLLHHIVDVTRRETDESVQQSLGEAHRTLRFGGRLVIIEMAVPRVVELAEDLLYVLTHRVFRLLGRPMVRFYSTRGLTTRVRAVDFTNPTVRSISLGAKWIDPTPALFPGRIKIPAEIYPAQCCALVAHK